MVYFARRMEDMFPSQAVTGSIDQLIHRAILRGMGVMEMINECSLICACARMNPDPDIVIE